MKIKTGDTVFILTGKDKGKTGKVVQVFPVGQRAVVEGMNKAVRHLRSPRKEQKGQKIDFPSPVHISNLAVVSPTSGKAGRVGKKIIEKEGKKVRIRVLKTKDGIEDLA